MDNSVTVSSGTAVLSGDRGLPVPAYLPRHSVVLSIDAVVGGGRPAAALRRNGAVGGAAEARKSAGGSKLEVLVGETVFHGACTVTDARGRSARTLTGRVVWHTLPHGAFTVAVASGGSASTLTAVGWRRDQRQ
jgi:hypothetical protein